MSSTRLIRMFAAGAIAALLAVNVSACGNGAGKTRSYGNDGYNGLQNSFPNLQVGTNNRGNQGYDEDSARMSRIVKGVSGVKSARLILNGPTVHVNLKADPSVPDEQLESVRLQVLRQLEYQIPRYVYDVEIKK